MNELLDKLRSPGAMMIALVLALFPQGEHTAQVFQHFSHAGSGNAQGLSYAFAAAVEVAVLLFVMAGHKRISGLFAGASFLTNVVYYAIGGVALLSVAAFPVLLLSALLPACIMGYSHTVADKTKHTDAPATPASPAATPARAWWQWRRTPATDDATHATLPVASATDDAAHAAQPATLDATDDAPDQPNKRTRAHQLRSEGYNVAEVARMVGAHRSTVTRWLDGATAQSNGGTHA